MFDTARAAPDPARLAGLMAELSIRAPHTASAGPWESGAFRLLSESGLLAGFVPADAGGSGAAEGALLEALVATAEACLTTALALTQWAAACRLVATGPADLRARLLPRLARGEETTTVGIAQLTTSRQHLGAPALRATRGDGWRLDGVCPWVTGADSVDTIVTGALREDGVPAYFVVDARAPGLGIEPPMTLLALSGSRTSRVTFSDVAPLAEIVPSGPPAARAGGLATTALAVGAARGALAILRREARTRPALEPAVEGFSDEIAALQNRLGTVSGDADASAADRDALRTAANGLVLRVAQGSLVASKGAGFVAGHPAERAVREAMLFLVWSCPQQVAEAVMCDLAHIDAPA